MLSSISWNKCLTLRALASTRLPYFSMRRCVWHMLGFSVASIVIKKGHCPPPPLPPFCDRCGCHLSEEVYDIPSQYIMPGLRINATGPVSTYHDNCFYLFSNLCVCVFFLILNNVCSSLAAVSSRFVSSLFVVVGIVDSQMMVFGLDLSGGNIGSLMGCCIDLSV